MAGRFLTLFKPLSRFMPEVGPPARRVGFNEKIFWTAMALVLYLIMCEVSLYKVGVGGGWELTYLRVIFASNRGSLMELGIGPIVTAGLILQLLAGSGMIACDFSDPEDRGLFTTASKFFTIVLTGVQASAYLIGGVYGDLPGGTATSIIIFLQLLTAGLVLMLLDEMIQKGWGIGSGISLFILAGVAQRVLWDSLGPSPPMQDGNYRGAFLALAQIIPRVMTGSYILGEPARGLWSWSHVFVRPVDPTLPAMLGFITTLAVFLIVIYAEGVRVELPISYASYRGFRGKYPIKLLYVSNLPVIFASALFANIYFFSQLLWSRLGQPRPGTIFWLDLLGQYEWVERQPQPVGGLVYYVTSPRSIWDVTSNPVRALAFAGIMIAFCIIFSLTWLEVGGLGPKTVAKQLVDSGMQIPGFRRSSRPIELVLKRYIPVVTMLGGFIVGLIASVADFFGVFGTGMGILLSVGIMYQYYQLLVQERVAEMYPAFRRFLGG
ncbi:MAG: preprotein translocase subunit SecY [Candidatus Bathyarchaeota archaeon BA2]|nr:MAG: preprotein translocase subunit SecY [Candidatus Bathyarchaeota archaeon BA2]